MAAAFCTVLNGRGRTKHKTRQPSLKKQYCFRLLEILLAICRKYNYRLICSSRPSTIGLVPQVFSFVLSALSVLLYLTPYILRKSITLIFSIHTIFLVDHKRYESLSCCNYSFPAKSSFSLYPDNDIVPVVVIAASDISHCSKNVFWLHLQHFIWTPKSSARRTIVQKSFTVGHTAIQILHLQQQSHTIATLLVFTSL